MQVEIHWVGPGWYGQLQESFAGKQFTRVARVVYYAPFSSLPLGSNDPDVAAVAARAGGYELLGWFNTEADLAREARDAVRP